MLDWMGDQGSETDRWRRRRARHRCASTGGVVTTRVAALPDVHGDLHALMRVLGVIERARPDEIRCLGTIGGLGADTPAAVVELVRQRCTLVLAGNHDCWVTGRLPARHAVAAAPARPTAVAAHPALRRTGWPGSPGCQDERRYDIELWHGSAQDPVTGWSTGGADAAGNIPLARARLRRAARPPCLSLDSTTGPPPRRPFSALRPRDR
jgi:hypothetical protein